jgi:Pro-kumamolisin, activation domain
MKAKEVCPQGKSQGSAYLRALLDHHLASRLSGTPLLRLLFIAVAFGFCQTVFAQAGNQSGEPMQAAAPGAILQPNPSGPVLQGHTPLQVISGEARLTGHYPAESTLRLAVALHRPDPSGEEKFLRELMDPNSPNFHAFLTAAQWNARFSPSFEDEQRVLAWAQSQGLKVTNRFPNRLLVDLEAPAGTIEKALGITINQYSYRDEVTFSNDRDPVLPPSVSGVITAVLGLNNIQRMRSSMRGVPEVQLPDYAPGPVRAQLAADHSDASRSDTSLEAEADFTPSPNLTNGYIDPADIYSSQTYDLTGLKRLGHCCNPHNDAGGAPSVSSIAIAAWGGFTGSDISTFANKYGLAWNWTSYAIDGTPGCPSGQSAPCPNDETTLDTEWSTATSNSFGSSSQTARVYIYIAGSWSESTNADVYNHMLNDGKARVFTTSWSCTENYGCSSGAINTWHAVFNSMVGQGWTLMAASGDRGSSDDCSFNNPAHRSVGYPGSDPDVLSIGGTSLSVYSDGSFKSEGAWQGGTSAGSCKKNGGGTGGGPSAIFSQPSYQSGLGGTKRLTPDISLNSGGIGQNYVFKGQVKPVGGTSIASPEFAGFFAQVNAYLNYIGHLCGANNNLACTPIGQPHGLIYYEGKNNNAGHNPYYDIKTGCNSNDVTTADNITFYCANTGYDQVTGWGSVNFMQFAWALNWELLANHANGIPYITFSGPAKNKWFNTSQTVSWTVHDYAGSKGPNGTGIAGFTQGWDSIPADPKTEPHGGTGNLFYAGPQYPNASNGCLALVNGAGGCAGGVSQGCHTAYVHGWNNEGWTTAGQSSFPESYGPVCYDTISPVTAYSIVGSKQPDGSYKPQPLMVLTATDQGVASGTGSGVFLTYYSIDNTSCTSLAVQLQCKAYSGPFYIPVGKHSIYYFSKDNAGNFEARTAVSVNVH